MTNTDAVGAEVDARVYFLSGESKAPVNVGHVIVPTQEVLENQRRVIENAVGTRLPGGERVAPEPLIVSSRTPLASRSVLARKRSKLRRHF